jgi:dTDP-4-amino-4,6-dideoxygalactose transaminase
MVHLFNPYVPFSAIEMVKDTLVSRWVGQGPKVDEFEKRFSEKFNQKYCVSMNSGSSALETAYELVGIKPGDEVITTPLTCTATNIPLLRMGAKIVWADIRKDTLCIDREDILRKITPKTKAIVNVHLGGIESDIGEMPVPVISDAAQALGIFTGDYTCNSFQAIKHITTGDGGMLTVNDEKEYKQAKLMRWFGIDREAKARNDWQPYKKREMTFDIEIVGYKRQMTDIAASMGIAGLERYDTVIFYRKNLFELYKRLLKYPVIDGRHNTYWLCTVLVHGRDKLAKRLLKNGIESNLVQVRNDAYKIFGGRKRLPVMDEVEDNYISLPLHMNVTEQDVVKICNIINERVY